MESLTKFLFLFFILAVFLTACAKTETTGSTGVQDNSATAQKQTPLENAKDALAGLLKNKAPTFMVSYDVSGAEEFSSMTIYSKSGKFRYDTVVNGNAASLFFIDGKTYSCTASPKMCLEFSGGEAPSTGTEQIENNIQNYDVSQLSAKTIAGTNAKCFSISSGTSEAQLCYSKEGIPLYMKTSSSASQTIEMTATKYSTSVDDSEFELPSQPQDADSMMQQYG